MPNVDDITEHLLEQDVVWVFGGSVAGLLAMWRLHGVDAALHAAWRPGWCSPGVSAGSICWHVGGTTDSFGPELRPVTDGLGFVPFSNGVHYDAEEQRRPLLHRLIGDGTLPAGYATDNGAGVVYRGTEFVGGRHRKRRCRCVLRHHGGRWHCRDTPRHPEALTVQAISLRPATADDVEFFFTLHAASLGPYVDRVWGWDDAEQRAYLARTLVLERARVIVLDGVDVGRLDVQEDDDEIFLALIELAPDHQGRGIGSRLIRDILDRADGSPSCSASSRSTTGRTGCTAGSASPRSRVTASLPRSESGWWSGRERQRVVASDARWLSEFVKVRLLERRELDVLAGFRGTADQS